jgi:hypothetical protein
MASVRSGKGITAIDAVSHDVLRTYDLGFTPAYATVAPDGTLWVADTDGGRVVIYQSASTTKVGEIAVGAGAHAIVFGTQPYRVAPLRRRFRASALDLEDASQVAAHVSAAGIQAEGRIEMCAPLVHVRSPATCRFSESSALGTLVTPSVR